MICPKCKTENPEEAKFCARCGAMFAQPQSVPIQTVSVTPEPSRESGMFKHLLNFSYKRDVKEAIGFYISYFVVIAILALLAGGIFTLISGNTGFEFGLRVGNIVAIIMSVVLSFVILKEKNLLQNFAFILLALLSGILAWFGGALLGLIPVAYLTTRQTR